MPVIVTPNQDGGGLRMPTLSYSGNVQNLGSIYDPSGLVKAAGAAGDAKAKMFGQIASTAGSLADKGVQAYKADDTQRGLTNVSQDKGFWDGTSREGQDDPRDFQSYNVGVGPDGKYYYDENKGPRTWATQAQGQLTDQRIDRGNSDAERAQYDLEQQKKKDQADADYRARLNAAPRVFKPGVGAAPASSAPATRSASSPMADASGAFQPIDFGINTGVKAPAGSSPMAGASAPASAPATADASPVNPGAVAESSASPMAGLIASNDPSYTEKMAVANQTPKPEGGSPMAAAAPVEQRPEDFYYDESGKKVMFNAGTDDAGNPGASKPSSSGFIKTTASQFGDARDAKGKVKRDMTDVGQLPASQSRTMADGTPFESAPDKPVVALPQSEMNRLGLKLGDKIVGKLGDGPETQLTLGEIGPGKGRVAKGYGADLTQAAIAQMGGKGHEQGGFNGEFSYRPLGAGEAGGAAPNGATASSAPASSGGGMADLDKLSPENIDREIALSASGGASAASGKGPVAATKALHDDAAPDAQIGIPGRIFGDGETARFVPNSKLPQVEQGNDIQYIPRWHREDLPDGTTRLVQVMPDGTEKPEGKNVPRVQFDMELRLNKSGIDPTLAPQIIQKAQTMKGSGRGGDKYETIISTMSGLMSKGMSAQEALDQIKVNDPKAVAAVVEKFNTQPEVKKMVEAGGVLEAYNEIQRLAAIPQGKRTAQDDHLLLDAMQRMSSPGRAGTVSDQKSLQEGTSSLKGQYVKFKNFLTGGADSSINDEQLAAARQAAERVFTGYGAGYDEQFKIHRKLIEDMGGDPSVLGRNRIEVLKESREQAQAAAKDKTSPKPDAPAAAAAAKPASTAANPVTVKSQDEFDKLPSGTWVLDDSGVPKRKK